MNKAADLLYYMWEDEKNLVIRKDRTRYIVYKQEDNYFNEFKYFIFGFYADWGIVYGNEEYEHKKKEWPIIKYNRYFFNNESGEYYYLIYRNGSDFCFISGLNYSNLCLLIYIPEELK